MLVYMAQPIFNPCDTVTLALASLSMAHLLHVNEAASLSETNVTKRKQL